jgi:hypothetical protein
MVKINFTGAGQYWLSSPEPMDGTGGGALWIDLGECETEADVLAAVNEYEADVLAAVNEYEADVLEAANEYTEAAAAESCWDGWIAAEVGIEIRDRRGWVASFNLLCREIRVGKSDAVGNRGTQSRP